jgi:hypothetical protein
MLNSRQFRAQFSHFWTSSSKHEFWDRKENEYTVPRFHRSLEHDQLLQKWCRIHDQQENGGVPSSAATNSIDSAYNQYLINTVECSNVM